MTPEKVLEALNDESPDYQYAWSSSNHLTFFTAGGPGGCGSFRLTPRTSLVMGNEIPLNDKKKSLNGAPESLKSGGEWTG
jgi:hypothetical protein